MAAIWGHQKLPWRKVYWGLSRWIIWHMFYPCFICFALWFNSWICFKHIGRKVQLPKKEVESAFKMIVPIVVLWRLGRHFFLSVTVEGHFQTLGLSRSSPSLSVISLTFLRTLPSRIAVAGKPESVSNLFSIPSLVVPCQMFQVRRSSAPTVILLSWN